VGIAIYELEYSFDARPNVILVRSYGKGEKEAKQTSVRCKEKGKARATSINQYKEVTYPEE